MNPQPDPPRPPAPAEELLDVEATRMLLEVSRRINAERVADSLLGTILDSLVAVTKADRGFLLLKDGDGLRLAMGRDRLGRPLGPERARVSESVVKEVAETGETRLIDDAATASAYSARMSIVNLSLRTILCVALKADNEILGVIYVDSSAITRRFTERDVPLVEAFAAQAAVALERVRLQEAELERDRMRSQLETASEIQRTFLPGTFPEADGLVGAVATVPALHVGGDFYDILRFPDGRTGFLVADVSGKGVPAALFGARLLSDVRYEALYHDDVGATLAAVNDIVARRSTMGMFVTLFYAVHDPREHCVTYASAGHPAPMLRGARGEVVAWDDALSVPLGVAEGSAFATASRRLRPGEVLVLTTDGVPDAAGPGGERFGEDRLRRAIASAPADPALLVRTLRDAVTAFASGVPLADDVTILAVEPR